MTEPFCLNCGYSLRGLDGDPVRCPECGLLNPIGPFNVPDELVERHLHQIRKSLLQGAAACLLALLIGIPGLILSLMGNPAFIIVSLVILVAMILTLQNFRSAFGDKPGWASAILRFQLMTVGSLVVIIGFTVMGMSYGDPLTRSFKEAFHVREHFIVLPYMGLILIFTGWCTHMALNRSLHMFDDLFVDEARRRAWEETRTKQESEQQ